MGVTSVVVIAVVVIAVVVLGERLLLAPALIDVPLALAIVGPDRDPRCLLVSPRTRTHHRLDANDVT